MDVRAEGWNRSPAFDGSRKGVGLRASDKLPPPFSPHDYSRAQPSRSDGWSVNITQSLVPLCQVSAGGAVDDEEREEDAPGGRGQDQHDPRLHQEVPLVTH
jgi:hypothetical protein